MFQKQVETEDQDSDDQNINLGSICWNHRWWRRRYSCCSFCEWGLSGSDEKKLLIFISNPTKKFRVRFRIDGNLLDASSQPVSLAPAIASRIKIMAKLDIAEKRRPQDGRIKVRLKMGRNGFSCQHFAHIVGRKSGDAFVDKSNLQLDMTKLGFESDDLQIFKEDSSSAGIDPDHRPNRKWKRRRRFILLLSELNRTDVNISTAEDPIEFNLEGINQVQMNPDIDLTFANALKSFCDKIQILLWLEKFEILKQLKLRSKQPPTGHLVVSTLHTNDAPATVVRLTEMGIPPTSWLRQFLWSWHNVLSVEIATVQCSEKICPKKHWFSWELTLQMLDQFKVMKGKGMSSVQWNRC